MSNAHTTPPQSAPPVELFNATHAALVERNLEAARVILRVALLAYDALDTEPISTAGKFGASSWSYAISAVLARIASVRDTLIETGHSPSLDWFTPLALATALDSALWESSTTDEPELTSEETKTAIRVLMDAIDAALVEWAALDKTNATSNPALFCEKCAPTDVRN